MIQSIRYRGLKRLYQHGDASGINPTHVGRLEGVLAHLECAARASDLDLPGYRLHPLKGELKGYWSVAVSGNWRVIFRMDDGDVYDVDLLDYH